MVNLHIFGVPEPHVHYTERRAAYVVIVKHEGMVAMVAGRQKYFLPGGGTGEHELQWLSLTEVEQACFHACHAWAISQVCRKDYC